MSKIADALIDHEERFGRAKAEFFEAYNSMLLNGWNYDDHMTCVECNGRMRAIACSAHDNFGDELLIDESDNFAKDLDELLSDNEGVWG